MKNLFKFFKAQFANESAELVLDLPGETAPEFQNAALVNPKDGWAMLAKYGDFPGIGFRKNAAGELERFPAIQRMDRPAAEAMAAKFNSPLSKIKRFMAACPIFNGHPNTLIADGKYPDKAPKGAIVELMAGEDALYCKPVFYNEAEAILAQPTKIFFSGHWTSDELPEENGKRIFRPDALKSAGLTPFPNLPVEHVNDKAEQQDLNPKPATVPEPNTIMDKKLIIAFLAAHGIQFANDAADELVLQGLKDLGARVTATTAEKTQLANDKQTMETNLTGLTNSVAQLTQERDTLRTNFANERAERVKGLIADAIKTGKITEAEKADWERRLADPAQFANESAALGNLTGKIKTVTITDAAGERKVEIANAASRGDAIRTLVNVEMERSKCDYNTAFEMVQKNNPALFAAMKQPTVKN